MMLWMQWWQRRRQAVKASRASGPGNPAKSLGGFRIYRRSDEVNSFGNAPNCKEAVQAAYRNLCTKGYSDLDALDASVRVLRLHHPELSRAQAYVKVDSWLAHEGEEPPTPPVTRTAQAT